jgi:predicted nuclease with TOPRIM domain
VKDTVEYFEKRERNNVAVRKSRDKAKQKQEETQQRVQQLVDENENLNKKLDSKQEQYPLESFLKSCS